VRDDRERLLDIADSIWHIERYTARGRGVFDQDELIQTWVVYHLQVIGEAARGLSDQLRHAHPEVAWSKMIGMRNILVHGYFGIDRDLVWSVVESDLPDLKARIESILSGS